MSRAGRHGQPQTATDRHRLPQSVSRLPRLSKTTTGRADCIQVTTNRHRPPQIEQRPLKTANRSHTGYLRPHTDHIQATPDRTKTATGCQQTSSDRCHHRLSQTAPDCHRPSWDVPDHYRLSETVTYRQRPFRAVPDR